MQSPAVAVRARELGLPVAQPAKIRDAAFLDSIDALRADAGIVVAYGKILPATLLRIPFYNVHASLLPKYRGAAPIQRAIERGEGETGVTIMRVDEELDHGPMLSVVRTPIGPDEHAPALAARLSVLGAEALVETLRARPPEIEQDHARATLAPKIEKSEGLVNWSAPARAIYDRFRAFDPWPGLFTPELKLLDIRVAAASGSPGTILSIDDDGVVVAAGQDAVRLIAVQRAGKPRVAAADLARGTGWRIGTTL